MNDLDHLKSVFRNKSLLDQALTHKSWVNEHQGARSSNERLEFLGDAILEYVVTEILYEAFPEKQEGYLTALRANLVNTQNLAGLAKKLALESEIFLSKGEEEGGGRTNSSLLANTVEALIGALYLDQGLFPVKEFIRQNLITEIPQKIAEPLKDPKSRLQEYVQSLKLPTPKYKVLAESGPDHDKNFVIDVWVGNLKWGRGRGKSKSQAEQAAAEAALSLRAKHAKIPIEKNG